MGGGTDRTASATVELRQRLHRTLIREIDQSALNSMPPEEAREFVEQAVRQLVDREVPAGRAGFRDRLQEQLVDDVLGLGPLEPLLRDNTISEIMVNGAKQVYVERAGKLYVAPAEFQDDAHVVHVIERILTPTGRTIDESNPLVDARLPDGSRVNAVIPPASITGPLLTIRKFVADRLTADDLVSMGSLSQQSSDILAAAVHAGLNIIVSGGTGSGKTTMLNVLSSWIPSDERIVTIEDPAELSLRQPHVVRLEARPNEHGGAIHQRDLLRNALRMRPDRIIVGEVRGAEAFDMLQAMNTGHDGSLSTVHANTPRDAVRRIENMVMMAGFDLPVRAIREQVASAIDVVLQVERMRDGTRRTVAVSEVVGMEEQTVTMQDLFLFEQRGVDEDGRIVGELKPTGLRPSFAERLESQGVRLPLAAELENGWAAG
jgi:pilus assembly protein CpaF